MQTHLSNKFIDIDLNIVTKAQDGDSFAQLDIGKKYFSAYYMENNCFVAFKWISLSAHQGNMEAQFRLADLYALGQGTEQSHTRAYEWYTKSAIQGYPKALIRIHNLYEDDKFMHCKGFQNQAEKREWETSHPTKHWRGKYIKGYRLQRSTLILNKAIEYYQQQLYTYLQSELENRNALLNLGFIYQHGYGTKTNIKLAIKYYTTAANQDSVEAQFNLGEAYQKSDNIQDNNQKAFQWYSKAGEVGSVAAGNRLGNLYEKGIGVEKDLSKALYWYTQAANKRYTEAQINVARMYRTGKGTAQDYTKAIQWYSMAAKEGSKTAQNCLDQICSQEGVIINNENMNLSGHYNDPINRQRTCSLLREHISEVTDTKTSKRLQRLAMNALRGDVYAMYEIGLKYRDGVDLPRDRDLYVKWIKNSAKRGCLNAQYDIGKSYENGHDDEQNYHKAGIWYKRGSLREEDSFQYHLGMMYYNGYGVREDPLEASRLFSKLAEKEHHNSQYQLGCMRSYGHGLRRDTSEAFDYFMKSANQRNCEAMYEVGRAYIEGKVIKNDPVKGVTWLKYALKFGSIHAGIQLLRLYNDYKSQFMDLDLSKYFLKVKINDIFERKMCYIIAMEYLHGDILKQDFSSALCFYKKPSLTAGDFQDWFSTPVILSSINCVDLLNMYKFISEKGIDNLEYNIGYAYEYGIQDLYTLKTLLDSNISEAIKWYTTASEKGDSRSLYRLGAIYETGKGVERDIFTAVSFYSKAVEKQNPDAMYRLAVLYLTGNGVSQNLTKAYNLFLESHNIGHEYSHLFLKTPGSSSRSKPYYLVFYEGVSSEEEDENKLLYCSDEEQSSRLAIRMLKAVADMGKISVQYQLGCLYEKNGDYSKAAYWLDRSLQGGITDAYYRLGILYEEGLGIQKDYSKARTLYQKATEKKHEKALYRLARLYHNGIGTSVDYHKAFMLYKEAANKENEPAQKIIEILEVLENQSTTEKPNRDIHGLTTFEIEKSLTMYECLAINGNTGLQFQLGQFYENSAFGPDYIKATKWYSFASASDHADATYHLGKLHELGSGVPQDYTAAIKLYNKASDLGCTKATYRLGKIYQNGLGVDVDYEKAFQYYTEASKKGNIDAQYKLGVMNDSTEHRVKDTLRALEWYTKSYSQGNDNARTRLALLDDDDKPYETFFYEKLAEILVKYMKVENNYTNTRDMQDIIDPVICSRLSDMYFTGKGIQKNDKKAWYYLKLAIDLNSIRHPSVLTYLFMKKKTSIFIKKNALKVHDIALCELRNNDRISYILLGLMYLGGIALLQGHNEDDSETFASIFESKIDLSDESSFQKNSTLGSIIIPKDYKKAFTYFLEGAKSGDDCCKLMVGKMYQCGYGVKQDFIKSSECYQSISKSSNFYQCYAKQYLCLLYAFGDGVEKNKESVSYLLQKNGMNMMYCFNLGQLYYYGYGVNRNFKAAIKYLAMASGSNLFENLMLIVRCKEDLSIESTKKEEHEYSIVSYTTVMGEAEYRIGIMYEKGQGVVKNSETAFLKFKKSAEYGNKKAQSHLNLYYSNFQN